MKTLRAATFGAFVVLFAVCIGSAATAAPADAPQCDPVDQAQLTATISADGHQATFNVLNAKPLCDAVHIGFAAYVKDADGFVVPQDLVDSATGTITTGSTVLTVTLPANGTSPNCFTQVDAFTGAVLETVDGSHQYGPRLLAYQWGETPTCGEVLAESTSTTDTTTTTKATSNTTDTVEAAQVTRATAAPSAAVLARTGPQFDVRPLVMLAGLLLMLGGAFEAWVHRPAS